MTSIHSCSNLTLDTFQGDHINMDNSNNNSNNNNNNNNKFYNNKYNNIFIIIVLILIIIRRKDLTTMVTIPLLGTIFISLHLYSNVTSFYVTTPGNHPIQLQKESSCIERLVKVFRKGNNYI